MVLTIRKIVIIYGRIQYISLSFFIVDSVYTLEVRRSLVQIQVTVVDVELLIWLALTRRVVRFQGVKGRNAHGVRCLGSSVIRIQLLIHAKEHYSFFDT